ncbi:hypothetical protein [Pinisolibacter aquiterrae]|uniref:hypothetical protein n=1 Tax=Pinisolibacter aquiterrae TaxID=2815579 RepID=UPI001C3D47AE|nr:hypothetical protein [Pinisolibacter aquiterrae]MBV5263238.1 hypothetical protein [Pinisolibacter aquiterrae]MCC8234152.1 hypothetical protein [Pinisolibacter aquiterrae]
MLDQMEECVFHAPQAATTCGLGAVTPESRRDLFVLLRCEPELDAAHADDRLTLGEDATQVRHGMGLGEMKEVVEVDVGTVCLDDVGDDRRLGPTDPTEPTSVLVERQHLRDIDEIEEALPARAACAGRPGGRIEFGDDPPEVCGCSCLQLQQLFGEVERRSVSRADEMADRTLQARRLALVESLGVSISPS